MALPGDTAEKVKEWTEGEGAKEKARKELVGELSAAMQAHGHDPAPIREEMGG